jgi:sarcosine dehydrogenase
MSDLPSSARIVIIGGASSAPRLPITLAPWGRRTSSLLERGKLTSGSTWHAAGLVGQLRSSASITQVLKYSVDLYNRLEAETGLGNRLEDDRLPAACHQRRPLDRSTSGWRPRRKASGMDMQLLTPARQGRCGR